MSHQTDLAHILKLSGFLRRNHSSQAGVQCGHSNVKTRSEHNLGGFRVNENIEFGHNTLVAASDRTTHEHNTLNTRLDFRKSF